MRNSPRGTRTEEAKSYRVARLPGHSGPGGIIVKAFPVINSLSHFDTRGGAIDDVIKRLEDLVKNADDDVVLSSYGVTDVYYDAIDNHRAYSKTVFDEDHPESNLFGLRQCMELYGHSHVEVEVGGTKATYAIVRVKED